MNGVPETREGKPLPEGGGLAFSPEERIADSVVFPRLRKVADSVSFFRNPGADGSAITVWSGKTCYSWPGFSEFLLGSEGWHSAFWTFGRLIPEFAEIARRQPKSLQELEILAASLGMTA